MGAPEERKSAAECDLRLQGLDHLNLGVRDLRVAAKFYTEILGGIVTKEPNWEAVRAGRTTGAYELVHMWTDGGHLALYWQPWGQPAPDQMVPHLAFTVETADQLDVIAQRLERADVPHVLAAASAAETGQRLRASLYFRDPDGNQLELTCHAYPFRPDLHVGPFDPAIQYYPWSRWRALVPDDATSTAEQRSRRGL